MLSAFLAACTLVLAPPPDEAWKPAAGPLRTRWSQDVRPENPWNVYPRPQFQRNAWRNLNGLWDFEVIASGQSAPAANPKDGPPNKGKILVPFAIESQLSGVGRPLERTERLIYRRSVEAQKPTDGSRVLLHFGAVDWRCVVNVNGKDVGQHEGGFDPFSFDITAHLQDGVNALQVTVTDPTDASTQPRGKQVQKPEGIFYTRVSGIWQTVWLETVPATSINGLATTCRMDGSIDFKPTLQGPNLDACTLRITVTDPAGAQVAFVTAKATSTALAPVTVAGFTAWTPETPTLYSIAAELMDDHGATLDSVRSYCAFRTVAATRTGGQTSITLNGKPYFMIGLLDQGWWPDGLYTAPTHDAMLYDLQVTRQCGFNTVRKHVKVEPATWYAACDRMGILVWQDMPSGDKSIAPQDADIVRTRESSAIYERELRAMLEWLKPFPSIVLWVPFNEGWGQFDSSRITNLIRQLDPTRLVTTASGWTDRRTGDTLDIHDYAPRLSGHVPQNTNNRAWVIGECGGFGLPEPGHIWKESGWGYTTYKDRDALTAAYEQLAEDLRELRTDGLWAAIYTQTTDVETELNGVMTYDRDIIKFASAKMAAANKALASGAAARAAPQVVVPNARDCARTGKAPPEWRMTTTKPNDAWTSTHFDASDWRISPGGFGTKITPGTQGAIGTEWNTNDIWLRQTVELSAASKPTHLTIHHDEDAEVWIDGKKVATLPGYTTGYVRVEIPKEIRDTLTAGTHFLAVHCKQTSGGQFIDVGLCRVENATPAIH